MALGVIPPLCASLSPVLAGPQGCSRGRWRSEPSKWRHTATLGGRGQGAPRTCRCIETRSGVAGRSRGGGQGAPRTCRCIETPSFTMGMIGSLCQGAPRTCRCIETSNLLAEAGNLVVREHHAPVGALRHALSQASTSGEARQGAPRTCRCIETSRTSRSVVIMGQGAPRTCRCIETSVLGRGGKIHEESGSTTHL